MSEARALRRRRQASYAIVALIMSVFIGTASLDHGYNWDEWNLLDSTRATVNEVEFVQTRHVWNGFFFFCGVAVVAAHGVDDLPQIMVELKRDSGMPLDTNRYPALRQWQDDMFRLIGTERFKVEVRAVFLVVTSLSILWVFLTILRLFPHRYFEAAGAAALLGLSWEIALRARCTEVDSPQMQFVALQIYLVACALTAKTRQKTLLAVMGVGAATGLVIACKVTGVYAVLPGLGLALTAPLARGARDKASLVLALVVCAAGSLAFFAPETIVDPLRVLDNALVTARDYRSVRPGYPFYVEAPFEHFGRILLWVFLVGPSSSVFVAAVLSAIALLGGAKLLRRRRKFALLVGIYPVLLTITMSTLPLLQQRNFVQLFPYVAIGFGAGLVALRTRWPSRRVAVGATAIATIAFVFNAGWLVHSRISVLETTRDSILEDVQAEMDGSEHDYYVSRRLHGSLEETIGESFECARESTGDVSRDEELTDPRVLMYYTDHHPRLWLSVRMDFVEHTFAPIDANYDWYATWKGRLEQHRVVLLSIENADTMHVDRRSFYRCRRR